MAKINKKPDFTDQQIFVGIDVHSKSWNVTLYFNQQYLKSFNQPPTPEALTSFLQTNYPHALYKCAYEAGFCGFWIQRALVQNGIDCIVINAADVPQTDKGAKNKTDTNDSKRIASALQRIFLFIKSIFCIIAIYVSISYENYD